MAGTIVADTLQSSITGTPVQFNDGTGTQIGTLCRAFVNFNGTTNIGGFCTIRASFNVTSVADNGTGDYTINFTTAMPDANYSVAGACQFGTSGGNQSFVAVKAAASPYQTTSLNVVGIRSDTAALTDFVAVNVAIFR